MSYLDHLQVYQARQLQYQAEQEKTKVVFKNELLNERGKTHGDFQLQGALSQNLKSVARTGVFWAAMSNPQREAVEMILHKVSRICSGNPNVKDHWDDIAGYANLIGERL